MRYTIHTADGTEFASVNTAQACGDVADHRTVSIDHAGGAFPFVVWEREAVGMVGTAYATHGEAFRAVAAIPKGANTMNQEQIAALQALRDALQLATNTGLLDELQGLVHNPDSINDMCDACDALAKG